jgi:hypothetical protein
MYVLLWGVPFIIAISIYQNYDNSGSVRMRHTYHGLAIAVSGVSAVAGGVVLFLLSRTMYLVLRSKRKWCESLRARHAQPMQSLALTKVGTDRASADDAPDADAMLSAT